MLPEGIDWERRETGERQRVQVPYDEGVARHIGPESCADGREAIGETIDQDTELRGRRELLLSVIGVGETLAASLMAEMPEPGVLRRSGEMVAYAGLNPSHQAEVRHYIRTTTKMRPCTSWPANTKYNAGIRQFVPDQDHLFLHLEKYRTN